MLEDEVEIKIEYYESFDKDPLKVRRNILELSKNKVENHVHTNELSEKGHIDIKNVDTNDNFDSCYKKISNKYACKYCSLTYLSRQTLRYHIKTKHLLEAAFLVGSASQKRRPKPKCHVCEKKFNDISKLEQHFLEHKLLEDDQGCQMKKTDLNKQEFIELVTKNKSKNIFKCPYCPRILGKKYSLKIHILTRHKTEKEYKYHCMLCSYKAPIKYYLKTHIASKHKETESAQEFQNYLCNKCGYTTIKKSHFINHINVHDNKKKYTCNQCDYATTNKNNLNIHLRIHMNEKPYSCSYTDCSYRCSSKSALRSHELVHNKDEYYIYCDKCSYRTVYKQSLVRHYNRHRSLGPNL